MSRETENMSALEMNDRARKSLSAKVGAYYENSAKTLTQRKGKFSSYEEAKQAGDPQAMISFKLRAHELKTRKLVSLTRELYETKSIAEIQSGIKEMERVVARRSETAGHLKEAQERKYRKDFSKIGGLSGIHLEGAVYSAMDEWEKQDGQYLAAINELSEAKKLYTAYSNAKELYLADNADLIAEAKEKARREEFVASGILEEMGITHREDTSED